MEDEMKGFWKRFILLALGAVISLVGALIGRTTVGFILFGLGLVVVVVVFALTFLKKSYFKQDRLKLLIFSLVLGVLLASSITLLVGNSGSSRSSSTRSNTNLFSQLLGRTTGQGSRGSSQFGNYANRSSSSGGSSTGNNYTGRNSTGNTSTSNNFSNRNSTGNTSASNNYTARATTSKAAITVGWVLLGVGLAILIMGLVFLSMKKINLREGLWKVLILGLIIGALLASSTTLVIARAFASAGNRGNFSAQLAGGNRQGLPGSTQNAGNETATPTVEPTARLTATPTATATMTPTATTVVVSSIRVCLNENAPLGVNLRVFPSKDAYYGGKISVATCFYLDGKSSEYPGWYLYAKGQGAMGVEIGVDENTVQLWVDGYYLEDLGSNLDNLPEVAVTGTK